MFSLHVRPKCSFYVLITYLLHPCYVLTASNTFFPHSFIIFATSFPISHFIHTFLPRSHYVHDQHVPSTFLLHICYILAAFLLRPTRSFHILITHLLHTCHVLTSSKLRTFLPRTYYIFDKSLPRSHYIQHVPSVFLLHICYILAMILIRPTRSFHVLIKYLAQPCHIFARYYKFILLS